NSFNKQKYTNLKQIKPSTETTDESDMVFSDYQVAAHLDASENLNCSNEDLAENTYEAIHADVENDYKESDKIEERSNFSKEESQYSISKNNRNDKDKDKEDWEISKNRGWLFFGLTLFLVGAGLGLAV